MTNWTKMKKIKEKILKKSKELFNEQGVAAVSIRQISRNLNISHSNLIYHFKNKNILLSSLHQQILDKAIALNADIEQEENALRSLFISTYHGFRVIYEYRFFMIDLNLIMRENDTLHKAFLNIEKLRAEMYEAIIQRVIANELMRPPLFEKEYAYFIQHIRIISDYWVSSMKIYDAEKKEQAIDQYARLFLQLFYPYLTEKGRLDFDAFLVEFGL